MDNRAYKIFGLGFLLLSVVGLLGIGLLLAGVYVVRPALAARLGEVGNPAVGLIVTGVDPDGPAARAGVVRGDILQEVDDEEINAEAAVARLLQDSDAGDQWEIRVLHGDEIRSFSLTLDDREGRPYLGMGLCCGRDDLFRSGPVEALPFELPIRWVGPVIVEVLPDTPAERAGLQEGDQILAINGERLSPEFDLADRIADFEPGERIELEISQPGEPARTVSLVLGENPEVEGAAYLGVRYRQAARLEFFGRGDLPPDEFPFEEQPFGLPHFDREFPFDLPAGVDQGTVIQRVVEGSPAEEAGLQAGEILTAVNGEPVTDPASLIERIAGFPPGETVNLTVFSPDAGEPRGVEVTLSAHPDDDGRGFLGIVPGGFFRFERLEEGGGLERFPAPFYFEFGPDGGFDFDFHFEHPEIDGCPFGASALCQQEDI